MDNMILMKIVNTLDYLPDDNFCKVFSDRLVSLQKVVELP
jgi:hypothetical protein